MKYSYFISFVIKTGKVGNICIDINAKIRHAENIKDIEENIRKKLNEPELVVLNYKLMRKSLK